jgi:hypothetical protein
MIELYLASENLPFSISLTLMVGIALLEGLLTIIGAGFSQFLDNLIPDMDIPDGNIDTGAVMETPSLITKSFGWIKIGRIPMLVVLIVFLTSFAMTGYILQSIVKAVFSTYLKSYIAVLPALVITLPFVKTISLLLAKFVIKDETSAVSRETFIGKLATITVGTAKRGTPAEGKLKDEHNQVHYVRIEPEKNDVQFEQGTEVLIVNKTRNIFIAINNPLDDI